MPVSKTSKKAKAKKATINSVYGPGPLLPPASGGGRTIGIAMKTGGAVVEISNGNMKFIGPIESSGKDPLLDVSVLHGIKAGLAVINMGIEEGQALCERVYKPGSGSLGWADDILMFNNSGDTED